jgi:hypothetical protein
MGVFENLPAAIWRSKVAISLREMSWRDGIPNVSRSTDILPASEIVLLISTERDGYFAGASSWFQSRAGHLFRANRNKDEPTGATQEKTTSAQHLDEVAQFLVDVLGGGHGWAVPRT